MAGLFLCSHPLMAFTTWTAVKSAMDDMIADGSWQQAKVVAIGNRRVEYNSPSEFWEIYTRIKTLAAQESGTYSRRTYAKQGG